MFRSTAKCLSTVLVGAITWVVFGGVAQAEVTHSYVPGKVGTTTGAGSVNDDTSLLFDSVSSTDLLQGLEGVLNPPIGTDPVHNSTITALDLTDGEFYGTGGAAGSNSSGGNGLYIINNGSASISYSGLGGIDIGKLSIFTSQPWHGDVDATVSVDTGGGLNLLYATGFLSPSDPVEWGEHRLDIFDAANPTMATGVQEIQILFDASQARDWNYFWEIDAIEPLSELLGDFNNDGSVDTIDAGILLDNMYGHLDGPVDHTKGDIDFDFDVDLDDFRQFKEIFNQLSGTVPEPASAVLLLGVGSVLLLRTRRRTGA